MIEQATAALDEPIGSNVEYRDRQRQMYSDYQAAWDSKGRDSHRAFLRVINDPDQRVKRFTAFGTMEQSRGVARQLNEAIGAARALLKFSFTDSRLDIDVPLARHAISSVGALSFKISDLSNPKPAKPGHTESTSPASPR